jgi:hypothetical protein
LISEEYLLWGYPRLSPKGKTFFFILFHKPPYQVCFSTSRNGNNIIFLLFFYHELWITRRDQCLSFESHDWNRTLIASPIEICAIILTSPNLPSKFPWILDWGRVNAPQCGHKTVPGCTECFTPLVLTLLFAALGHTQ